VLRRYVRSSFEGVVVQERMDVLNKWYWQENVDSEEQGQALALSKLRDNLSAIECAELDASDPAWASYGPK
jgi:hypothetical protein